MDPAARRDGHDRADDYQRTSRCRAIAGLSGFLILIQSRDARPAGRAHPLRDDTLEAELACLLEDGGAVRVGVLAEYDANAPSTQKPG
jgi:hypothetical protein